MNVAWPDAFSVADPSESRSARKTTVPFGVPAPLVTVAVNVSELPNDGVVVDAVTVVVVGDNNWAWAGIDQNKPARRTITLQAGTRR